MNHLSIGIAFVFFLTGIKVFSQTTVSGTIVNSETGEPVPYAYVMKKTVNRGAITNEDGYFELACDEGDTLVISFVSFDKLVVPYTYFQENKMGFLKPSDNELAKVDVFADFDFLYTLFEESRKKLRQADHLTSKTYFALETTAHGIPVELLECYYNAEIGPSGIDNLSLKNGRIGMSQVDETYYASLNTTAIISDYRLLNKRDNAFPTNPLQLSKTRLKKEYDLKLVAFEGGVYKIRFNPQSDHESLFNAFVWIDKKSEQIVRVDLFQENLEKHPFVTLDPGHKMDSLNFAISYTFSNDARQSLDKIEFDYDLRYNNGMQIRTMESGGVFLFFQKDAAFDLPYYSETSHQLSDYDKIVSQPYNAHFWDYNEILSPSRKATLYKAYFQKTGVLLNFDELSKRNSVFKNRIVQWSERRILIDEINGGDQFNIPRRNNEVTTSRVGLVSDFYELVAHIYLDRNVQGDSVYYLTKTLIDLEASYYYLKLNKNTSCMINMYFDLVELERRDLEEVLAQQPWTKQQVDSLYLKCQDRLNNTLKVFLTEIEHGDNAEVIEKYNKAILGRMGIDNSLLIWNDFMAEQLDNTSNPDDPLVALYNYGTALMKMGKYEEAMPHLLKAYNSGGRDPWLVYNIGLNYLKLGDIEQGCAYLAMSKSMGEEVPKELISECEN